MNAAELTKPEQYPANAKYRYTPAAVAMKRFTIILSDWLTKPVYSQIVIPVMMAKSIVMERQEYKIPATINTTKKAPVIALITRFLCLSLMIILLYYQCYCQNRLAVLFHLLEHLVFSYALRWLL